MSSATEQRRRSIAAKKAADSQQHLDHAWRAIDSYFDNNPYHLTQHHLSSYDEFTGRNLGETIRSMNPGFGLFAIESGKQISVQVAIGRSKVYLDKPTIHSVDGARPLFPNEARLKNATYAANVYADVEVTYTENDKEVGKATYAAVRVGLIPIMLHSKACYLHGLSQDALREMGECVNDRGGYFVVGGKEKVIISRERPVYNRMFFMPGDGKRKFRTSDGTMKDEVCLRGKIRCMPPQGKGVFTRTIIIDLRDSDAPTRPGVFLVTMKDINGAVPLFILFRALGIESDKSILEHVLYDLDAPGSAAIVDKLLPSLRDVNNVMTQHEAIQWIAPMCLPFQKPEHVKHALLNGLFPNVADTLTAKALYLGYLVRQAVDIALGAPMPDRDSFVSKRVDLSGYLLSNLFRDIYRRFRTEAIMALTREYKFGAWKSSGVLTNLINTNNIRRIFNHNIVTSSMLKSMRGDWNPTPASKPGQAPAASGSMEGVVQDLSRVSHLNYVAHVRRVSNPNVRTFKLAAPHRLHGSQWGIVCPIDSPDGANIGLLKHMSVLSHITTESYGMEEIVKNTGMVTVLDDHSVDFAKLSALCKVFVNDSWIAMTAQPKELLEKLRHMRRTGACPLDSSLAWNVFSNELRVCVDAGRCCRPLIRIDTEARVPMLGRWLKARGAPAPTWIDFFVSKNGDAPLELIDVEEAATILIAERPELLESYPLRTYTHCELHPGTMFSAVASTYPFINHNNAAYNSLCIAQFKQAIGVYTTSFRNRMDVIGYVLHYPQRPLVSTKWADRMESGKLMHGENLIIAIATYGGYNQEDAVLLNKDSIQRGAFNITSYTTVTYEEKNGGDAGERIIFANPLTLESQGHAVEGIKFGRYDLIDQEGMPAVNSVIQEDDIVMGMTRVEMRDDGVAGEGDNKARVVAERVVKQSQHQVYVDASKRADRSMAGMVDGVFVYDTVNDEEPHKCCKLRMRRLREPVLGDKVASRFGQKGVVGMLLRRCDMPFSHTSGIVPDIIINPHGFPKRMTVAHLLETVLTKAALVGCKRYNATVFETDDVTGEAQNALLTRGFHPYGNEVMYNGRTGEMMACDIMVSCNYYGRLKHLVDDKINFRSTGPLNAITRQPAKGNNMHGGLRIGEMEQHALISHGMSTFLKESFMERSDGSHITVDREDHTIMRVANDNIGLYQSNTDTLAAPRVGNAMVPFAFRLLHQEMQLMGVDAGIYIEGDAEEEDDAMDWIEGGGDDADADADADAETEASGDDEA